MNVYDFVTYIDEPVSKLFPLNLIKQSSFSSLTVFVLDIVNLYITWKFKKYFHVEKGLSLAPF